MRFIDINDHKPSDEWLTKANELTRKLINASTTEERHKIIDNNEAHWKELNEFLYNISNGKCWYSESKENYSYMHIDHFRPKKKALDIDNIDRGGYWWLAFDWKNYRYCGSVGNTNKRDKFAVERNKANSKDDPLNDEIHYFLDPIKRSDPLKLSFDHEGKAIPESTDNNSRDYKRAKYTIENLKLNDFRLEEARRVKWRECSELIKGIDKLLDSVQRIPSAANEQLIEEKMIQLSKQIKNEAEFSAAAITCCMSHGTRWSTKIAISK